MRKALLVFHAPRDTVVGIENASAIFQAARHPKSFVSLDGADHLLSRRADAHYVASVLAAWAARYVPALATPDARMEPSAPDGVLVRETGKGSFQQEVLAAGHRLFADEPVSAGGMDTGMTPYEFLLAGLGACTAMTIRMYADRKKLPLGHVSVRLSHEKIHAEKCPVHRTLHSEIRIQTRLAALSAGFASGR